jgi:hypothetical protein
MQITTYNRQQAKAPESVPSLGIATKNRISERQKGYIVARY